MKLWLGVVRGRLTNWIFFVGDSFNTGDVLLEIETDKAQIDVEAQDDGILAKIYCQNGAKNIQVGDGIAILAEPGDDLASLEIPSADSVKASSGAAAEAPKEEAAPEAPKEESSAPAKKSSSSVQSSSGKANPDLSFAPSVQGLLHANGISKEDALSKIPASGPNGRLLKGDILAYLGKISQESVDIVSDSIKKLQHLDLSNIKIKQPEPESQSAEKSAERAAEQPKPAKKEPVVLRNTISLTDINLLKATAEATYNSSIPVETLVNKASKLASKDIPSLSKPKPSVLYDPVFEDLVTPSSRQAPFTVEFSYTSSSFASQAQPSDIYDILGSSRKPVTAPRGAANSGSPQLVNVSVKVNEKVPGSTKKAQLFMDRLGYYLTEGKGELIV